MLKLPILGHLMRRTHWKDWSQEEKGMTGWDGWIASLTQWTWVWAKSGRQWRTGSLVGCSPWGHKNWTRPSDQATTPFINTTHPSQSNSAPFQPPSQAGDLTYPVFAPIATFPHNQCSSNKSSAHFKQKCSFFGSTFRVSDLLGLSKLKICIFNRLLR